MTTPTLQELSHPQKSAGQIAQEIEWIEITEGTEKQIKFAKDLRNSWLSEITGREYIAKVRWASIQEKITNRLDYSRLANDAWNRQAIAKLNTSSAKIIIDFFKDAETQATKNDTINRYTHVIQYPEKWNFDGKKWVRTNYK